ncbi:MAG: hypothetical protein Q9190_002514 [Brigantiaea leucoxantha]
MAAQLKQLPEIERLSSLVVRILGCNPGKEGTNTYLIGTGHQRLLIDTGEGKPEWRNLLSSVLSSEAATISQAILTHWHPDHVGGVKDLLALCPEAKIHKNNPDIGQEPIQNGQHFDVEGARLRAFHCPGHTTDHMSLILNEEDAMFTGDNVLGHGTAVFENLATYLDSLDRMRDQFSGRAYPGHGPVIDDGRQRISEYVLHRQQREQQVLAVLEDAKKRTSSPSSLSQHSSSDDERSPMQLVKVIYSDVPETLHEPAAHGVVQILQKLSKEGKVAQSSEGKWRLADERGDSAAL